MKEKSTERIMLRIRKSSLLQLKWLAGKEERTVASVVRQAIQEYLEKREEPSKTVYAGTNIPVEKD